MIGRQSAFHRRMDTTHRDFYKGVDEMEVYERRHMPYSDNNNDFEMAKERADYRNHARPYSYPFRPLKIDPEWAFSTRENLEGLEEPDLHSLPPHYRPFNIVCEDGYPTQFKFKDKVFYNTRTGERHFMNRLWHNYTPDNPEQAYSVVPGHYPPVYVYDDGKIVEFHDGAFAAIPWQDFELEATDVRLGERMVMGKYLTAEPVRDMTLEMAKAVLSKTELVHRKREIVEKMEMLRY